jgi:polyhydroxybutyrate depolymerase
MIKPMKAWVLSLFCMAMLVVTARADTIEINGAGRTYLIDGAGAKPKPLVLALHGGGGSGRQFRRSSGLLKAALREGFVIVFPDGAGRNWNDGRTGSDGKPLRQQDDDAFLTTLVNDLVKRKIADPDNLFVTGMSNGGMMAFRLVCNHPKLFAGAVPVAANLPVPTNCGGKGHTQIWNIVGTEDTLMPFKGGAVAGRRGRALSAEETIQIFFKKNGCTDIVRSAEVDRIPDDGTRVSTVSGGRCRVAVQQVRIHGEGHAWPGGRRSKTREFDAGQAVIDYFVRFSD